MGDFHGPGTLPVYLPGNQSHGPPNPKGDGKMYFLCLRKKEAMGL